MGDFTPNPAVKQEKVIIPSNKGQKLVGLLHDTGSKQVVVLCSGSRGTKEEQTMVNLATAISNEGISAFRFDFSGIGLMKYELLSNTLLTKTKLLVVIVGHSKGGDDALLYASKYHDISAVVNIAGRYDLSTGIEEKHGKELIEKVKQDGSADVIVKNKAVTDVFSITLEGLMDRLEHKCP